MNRLTTTLNNAKTALQLDRDRHTAIKVMVAVGLVLFVMAKFIAVFMLRLATSGSDDTQKKPTFAADKFYFDHDPRDPGNSNYDPKA